MMRPMLCVQGSCVIHGVFKSAQGAGVALRALWVDLLCAGIGE